MNIENQNHAKMEKDSQLWHKLQLLMTGILSQCMFLLQQDSLKEKSKERVNIEKDVTIKSDRKRSVGKVSLVSYTSEFLPTGFSRQ